MSNLPIHVASVELVSAQSMSADITSGSVNINAVSCFAVQCNWSNGSSPVGSLELQASNDNSTYVAVSSQAVSGNSGSYMFNVEKAGYSYFRVFYDRTSGSGDLTVKYTLKQV